MKIYVSLSASLEENLGLPEKDCHEFIGLMYSWHEGSFMYNKKKGPLEKLQKYLVEVKAHTNFEPKSDTLYRIILVPKKDYSGGGPLKCTSISPLQSWCYTKKDAQHFYDIFSQHDTIGKDEMHLMVERKFLAPNILIDYKQTLLLDKQIKRVDRDLELFSESQKIRGEREVLCSVPKTYEARIVKIYNVGV